MDSGDFYNHYKDGDNGDDGEDGEDGDDVDVDVDYNCSIQLCLLAIKSEILPKSEKSWMSDVAVG